MTILLRSVACAAVLLSVACYAQARAPGEPDGKIVAPVTREFPAHADEKIILRVHADKEQSKSYTLADIERLGMVQLDAKTFWSGYDGVYQGVLLSRVLADSGLEGQSAIFVEALDRYSTTIPATDWKSWPVVLVTRRNSVPMPVIDKGPLWIMYPIKLDEKRLSNQTYVHRWIWQVKSIHPDAP